MKKTRSQSRTASYFERIDQIEIIQGDVVVVVLDIAERLLVVT